MKFPYLGVLTTYYCDITEKDRVQTNKAAGVEEKRFKYKNKTRIYSTWLRTNIMWKHEQIRKNKVAIKKKRSESIGNNIGEKIMDKIKNNRIRERSRDSGRWGMKRRRK